MRITRTGIYMLTAISAALYIFLHWAFADDLWTFSGRFWALKAEGETSLSEGSVWTYVLFAVIILAGIWQANRIPERGIELTTRTEEDTPGQIHDPKWWRLLLGNTYLALFWLPIRFFVGREWLIAGEHKIRDAGWMETGDSLKGFWTGAVAIPEGGGTARAGAYEWYRQFIQYMLDHEWYTWFAKLVAVGEFLIGLGLIVGALVGIAAFFGTLLNFSFIMAGTASSNPVLFGLGVFLVLAWKVAGYIGLDRFLLPMLGTPWQRPVRSEQLHDRRRVLQRRTPA